MLVFVATTMKSFMRNKVEYLISQNATGRTLIFDLDDTIYSELDFLMQQYFIVAKSYLPNNVEAGYNFLVDNFKTGGRNLLFDKFKNNFKVDDDITNILKEFRNYSKGIAGSLNPFDWFIELSNELKDSLHLIVITNGNVEQQKEKLRRLMLERFFKKITYVYANEHGPKPSSSSFIYLKENVPLFSPIYIGDSSIDLEFSNNCELEFLHINGLV